MKQSFLNTYHHLNQQNMQPQQNTIHGLWLLEGNEPLMMQWLVDAFRPIWRHHEQSTKRIELVSSKTWHDVLTELNSLSLFDPASAIIVSGNHKPDKIIISALADFAHRTKQNAEQNPREVQHHVIWQTNKLDKKSLTAKWIAPFIQSGHVIDCNIYDENQRLTVLQHHAHQFYLNLNNEAWQFLMSHTQNNLLNAYQTLWRLSYLISPETVNKAKVDTTNAKDISSNVTCISLEQLQESIVSESKYNVYDLSDAMLIGNTEKVIDILNGLKNMGEPPTLVLWTISKDMRLIQQLHAGKDAKNIGIWRNKERLYSQAMRRVSAKEAQSWSKLLLKCDQSIKGIINQPIWELLVESSLKVTGINLFNH